MAAATLFIIAAAPASATDHVDMGSAQAGLIEVILPSAEETPAEATEALSDTVDEGQEAAAAEEGQTQEAEAPVSMQAVQAGVAEIVSYTAPEETLVAELLQETAQEMALSAEEETEQDTLVIACVDQFVNVRAEASTDSDVVGKMYDQAVGELLAVEGDWYKIRSGNVVGYVHSGFCVTGEEAQTLSSEIGTTVATVNTPTINLRSEPSADAEIVGMVPQGEVMTVREEVDGFVRVREGGVEGYLAAEYLTFSTDYVTAESRAEEEARLRMQREEAERQLAAAAQNAGGATSTQNIIPAETYATEYNELGAAVVAYALQFVGNPYVHGGNSLTNGTDCSGFTMLVYQQFGVSLPRSSDAYYSVGIPVDGIANAMPGDIMVYPGHVAIYMGNNQIVHASTRRTGIKISSASYRAPVRIARILQ